METELKILPLEEVAKLARVRGSATIWLRAVWETKYDERRRASRVPQVWPSEDGSTDLESSWGLYREILREFAKEQALRVIAANAISGIHPEPDAPVVLRSKDKQSWLVIGSRETFFAPVLPYWFGGNTGLPELSKIMTDYEHVPMPREELAHAVNRLRETAV
jgi:hypothetical protein